VARKDRRPIEQELPLKSGARWTIKIAKGWEDILRNLLEDHPDHFRALVSLIQGRPEAVTEQQFRDLRKWGYLARDRSPLPGARAIIEAAYRETPDGPALVESLDVRTPADAALYTRAEEQLDRLRATALDRAIRDLDNDQPEKRGGRPR